MLPDIVEDLRVHLPRRLGTAQCYTTNTPFTNLQSSNIRNRLQCWAGPLLGVSIAARLVPSCLGGLRCWCVQETLNFFGIQNPPLLLLTSSVSLHSGNTEIVLTEEREPLLLYAIRLVGWLKHCNLSNTITQGYSG